MVMENRLNVASLFQVPGVQPFQLNIMRHVIQRQSSIVGTVRQERYGVTQIHSPAFAPQHLPPRYICGYIMTSENKEMPKKTSELILS